MLQKIVIIGPESTGKTTLCQQMAQHYNSLFCPEFAREYLVVKGKNYCYNDLLEIAKGQINLEEKYIHQSKRLHNKKLFIDTDLHVIKIWSEYVFHKCELYITDEILKRSYDLYLLCNIDLPWVADDLRELPNEKNRKELFDIYHNILKQQNTPFKIISGTNNQRLQNAIAAVDEVIS